MMDLVWKRHSVPSKGSPPPPFIVTRRRGVHEWGRGSRRFPPNRGGTVIGHYRKYTVGHGVRRGSRFGHRPRPCRDRAGVLTAPTGGVVVVVGRIIF